MKTHVKPEKQVMVERLLNLYPVVPSFLDYQTPFQLLIAVILSAQCTDAMVNKVTPDLFKEFPDPSSLAEAPLERIETLVHRTGFYRSKARHIKETSCILQRDFNSQVPGDFQQLIKLPGVGRKTAHVICGTLFNQPAIIVDTHFKRVTARLGLTKFKDPLGVEKDLATIVDPGVQYQFSMAANIHGRLICKARSPLCRDCILADLCPSAFAWEPIYQRAQKP